MTIRTSVHDLIGGPQLNIERFDEGSSLGTKIAEVKIPKEHMGHMAALLARYAFHNNLMTEADGDFLRQLVEAFITGKSK